MTRTITETVARDALGGLIAAAGEHENDEEKKESYFVLHALAVLGHLTVAFSGERSESAATPG